MEDIKVTDEMLDNVKEFRGRFFKEFMTLGEGVDEDILFRLFVERGLESAGVEIEDAYEQLSLPDFARVLSQVMEINNMDELFRAIERLNRAIPGDNPNK